MKFVSDFPVMIENMRYSQRWLLLKIASLQSYLSQPMEFKNDNDNGLGEALETRCKIRKAMIVTENTIDHLKQAPDDNIHDWLIEALQLQCQGYTQHLNALDLMPEVWEHHDSIGVYKVITLIIDALKLIAQGQQRIIYGLELLQFEPDTAILN